MAEAGKKIPDYTRLTAPTANTLAVVDHNGTTYSISINNLFANNSNTVPIKNLVLPVGNTPANSTALANLTIGQIWHDANNIYLATSANTVVRLGPFVTF